MLRLIERAAREPLLIIAALWPLVMLGPFVPGLPRPSPSGLTWRQETLLALLFCVTLALLVRRGCKTTAWLTSFRRTLLTLVVPLTLFVAWSAASLLWAANPYPALHHTIVWAAYLLFFLLMQQVAGQPRLLRASVTSLGVIVFIISTACIIGFWTTPLSLLRNNGLGEPIAVAVPLFTALALKLRQQRAATLCGVTATLAWLSTLQTFERSTFIGASVGLMLVVAASIALPQFRSFSLRRAGIIFAVFAAVTALQTMPSPVSPMITKGHPTIFTRLKSTSAADPNTSVRFLFWGVGLEMLRAHPVTGVGANNYDVAFAEARAQFSLRHPDSSLVEMNEGYLTVRAHNEYVQILAELGTVGFTLFVVFCVALLSASIRALRYARSPLVPGAIGSLAAMVLSSGASSISFRWFASGLMFFFAAALISRAAAFNVKQLDETITKFAPPSVQRATAAAAIVFSIAMLCAMSIQATNVLLNGAAQASRNPVQAESRFRSALLFNPYDAASHFNYGLWLYKNGRADEAVPHLRYATDQGLNSSVCYAYLIGAEVTAGDLAAAEQTSAYAVRVYPRSVFLRVRYAAVFAQMGKTEEARQMYATAIQLNDRAARGWQQLIDFGSDAASAAALDDPRIALPGELQPVECVYAVLAELEQRPSMAFSITKANAE